MPFREKMKSLVKTRSRGDTLTKSDSQESSRERWPSNVYKPGEPMPRPKYRAPPEKKHKERLEAFSFTESWRRKSHQSMYSPMGTRAPSRRTSFISLARRKSYGTKSQRTNSVTSAGTEKSRHRTDALSRLNTQTEAEGDDDVTNVGMSRVQSADTNPPTRPLTAEGNNLDGQTIDNQLNGGPPEGTQAHDHQPFTEQDLALALSRTKISDRSR